ncbi:unnamed protein product [Haemonchus placei]|uniref:Uncharacterized protein n=1 Tax=Haemonchus placei TaxID=6290 RepID=A0A0N4WTP1_HAEPC|nr:unnamed protein product [Haemonchus placei]
MSQKLFSSLFCTASRETGGIKGGFTDPNGPMSPDRPGGAFGFGGGGLGVAIPPNMRGRRDLQGANSF